MPRRRRTAPQPLAGASVGKLQACAQLHLDRYTEPDSWYAFRAYDRLGEPDTLSPVDCLAPVLLNVRMTYAQVVPLFHSSGPGTVLMDAMQAVLDAGASQPVDFLALDLADPNGPWQLVDRAVFASGQADGRGVRHLKAVAVTKILHRKRPTFVPIFDGEVYRFYFGEYPARGAYAGVPRAFWPVLQADVRANRSWLAELAATTSTPDDRQLSLLRAADIVIWEHAVSGCSGT